MLTKRESNLCSLPLHDDDHDHEEEDDGDHVDEDNDDHIDEDGEDHDE